VDARIVVDSGLPTYSDRLGDHAHLPILPYPSRLEQVLPLRGGGEYTVRPIHPDDAHMLQALVQSLSPESRYFRFVSSMKELPPAMLSRFTLIDYDREMAMVAVIKARHTDEQGEVTEHERIIGVSRYVTNPDHSSCEFSLVVADDFSGKGLGARLMECIMDVARERGLSEIEGLVLANNASMLRLMRALGFAVKPFEEDPDFVLCTHSL
jgi:acetyltransferase